jgi:Protein of unknown function (DUF998)
MKNSPEIAKAPLLLLAGILAPAIFVSGFTIEGCLRADYSAVAMHVSALSLGPRGWIQIVNFLVFGSLLGIFALHLLALHKAQNISKAGPMILLISAASFFLSGPFVMDPMETARENMTPHGLVHGILGGIVFVLMPITCFVFGRSMKDSDSMRRFRPWTLVAGCVIATAMVVFTLASKIPNLHALALPYQGLLQRAEIVPYMVWLLTFAWKKTRLHQTRSGHRRQEENQA